MRVPIVVAMTSSHNNLLVATLEIWETEKRPKALQLSLQCDFRLEAVGKERLTCKAEEG